MKRIVITLCVFLLLGAIVNAAVAWGCAYGLDEWRSDALLFELQIAIARMSGDVDDLQTQQSNGWCHALTVRATSTGAETTLLMGWPARALTAQVEGRGHMLLQSRESLLPTPIWPGFAINTLFYAVILWLLFAFPFALRRWRRIRRGLCAKCAYPVAASDVCTECGAVVHGAQAVVPPASQQVP